MEYMKVVKILLGLVLIIVLVVIAASFYVANNINGLVKNAVQDLGSQALQVQVTLDSADVDILNHRVSLLGLTIANPPGFNEPYIFNMDNVLVDLDASSLLNNVVSIEQVLIDGAKVVAEHKGTTTNLQALQANMPKSAEAPAERSLSQDPASEQNVLIKVALFQFINSETRLVSDRWGDRDVELPTIELKDIGGQQGVPPEALADAFLQPLIKQLNEALEDQLKAIVKEKAKEKLKEKEGELKAKLNDKLEEKLGSDTGKAVDGLKSLFSK
jgi:hypothetical protein